MNQPAILFSASTSLGRELWFSDGTTDGTRLVKDLNPGSGSSNPSGFTPIGNGRMLFTGDGPTTFGKLWVTDGTEAGTTLVKDVLAGNAGGPLAHFRAIGEGRVLFSAYDADLEGALWVSDGTAAGTQKLIDFYPGPFSAFVSFAAPRTSPSSSAAFLEPQGFTSLGDGRFVFGAGIGGFQVRLFVTDGSVAGTSMIDVVPPTSFAQTGNLDLFTQLDAGRVLFRAQTADGIEPWVTDGTAAGTFVLRDILPGGSSFPTAFTALGNGRAIFFATGPGSDPTYGTGALWATDGTVAGTVQISSIHPGLPDYIATLGDGRVVFAANDTVHGLEPFVTDGTPEGTRLIRDIRPGSNWSDPKWFSTLSNGKIVFQVDDGVTGNTEVWITDGTDGGTTLLGDLNPVPFGGSSPQNFYALGDGRTVFNATVRPADAELWITDGSTAGTTLLKDIYNTAPVISAGVLISNGRSDPSGFASFTVPAITLNGNDAANMIKGQDGADVLGGGGGNDTLSGGWGDDLLSGGVGADRLMGGDGNDTLSGSAGDDIIDGGAGADVAAFGASFARYAFAQSGGLLMVDGPDGVDLLTGIETLRFIDFEASLASLSASIPALAFAVTDTGTGRAALVAPTVYSGPVERLRLQFLGSEGGEAVAGTASHDFFNTWGGNDAVAAGRGDDVIDGGTGSNFLTGGPGMDTFFLDGRGGATTWSTITDWEVGEQLSLFGWRPGVSRVRWVDQDGTAGYRGVTLHGDLDGNGVIETSVTWTGMTRAALPTPLEFDNLLWFT